MKISNLNCCALSVWISALLTAACGELQTASLPTGTHLAQTNGSGSKDLVYVGYGTSCGTFCGAAVVNVYTFPKGLLIGSWLGASSSYTSGECGDGAGNVFVTYSHFKGGVWRGEILKFGHGGTSPVATLSVGNEQPVACSVDPNSGNLAVVNVVNGTLTGTLLIFSNASGSPTAYNDPNIIFYSVAYDDMGNIFAYGIDFASRRTTLAELPKGGTSFEEITLDKSLERAYEVAWDGHHVTLGIGKPRDYYDGFRIERIDIRRGSGHVVGITGLKHMSHDAVLQYWVADKQVVVAWVKAPAGCPVSGCGPKPGGVGIWGYPTGSTIVKRFTQGRARTESPTGVALSLGQRL